MGRKSGWTLDELHFIRGNAGTMKDKDLASAISAKRGKDVSVQSVRKQRQKMGVVKQSGRGKCAIKPASQDVEVIQRDSAPETQNGVS